MTAWRLWWRKAITGLAAILVVGFQMFGTVYTPVGPVKSGFHYQWSEYGLRATMAERHPFARLEKEVREEPMQNDQKRGRSKQGKAAS